MLYEVITKDIFEDFRVLTEPAGALAVAGIKRFVEDRGWRDKAMIAINSGVV